MFDEPWFFCQFTYLLPRIKITGHNSVINAQTFQPINIGQRPKKPGKGKVGEQVKVY
jgi:hypothetical protein